MLPSSMPLPLPPSSPMTTTAASRSYKTKTRIDNVVEKLIYGFWIWSYFRIIGQMKPYKKTFKVSSYSSAAHRNPIYCWGGHSHTYACNHTYSRKHIDCHRHHSSLILAKNKRRISFCQWFRTAGVVVVVVSIVVLLLLMLTTLLLLL